MFSALPYNCQTFDPSGPVTCSSPVNNTSASILLQTSGKRRTANFAAMEFHKHSSVFFAIAVAFALNSLANSLCTQKGEGQPVKCCDQRENGGSLLCCSGRNSSCGMEDFVNDVLCFCDEFCEGAGDCCQDFESIKEPCGFGKGRQH